MNDNNQRYAVIDLGTNTFHALIVEKQADGNLTRLYKERIYVKLADKGIDKISPAAFSRAVAALEKFKCKIDELGISKTRAFGTAALRTASNGKVLVTEVRKKIGIDIDIISGKEEARLIHQGVMKAIPKQDERIVIMDIGGGSVEFIIADNENVYWSESFPVGVAVLFRKFHHEDPVNPKELDLLCKFLEETLRPFFQAMEKFKAKILVGASGTFDVLEIMMEQETTTEHSAVLKMETFPVLYDKIIHTTLAERLSMTKIPDTRADMIIVALELIRFVIDKTKINDIIVSSYAMKEGILNEMVKENKLEIE